MKEVYGSASLPKIHTFPRVEEMCDLLSSATQYIVNYLSVEIKFILDLESSIIIVSYSIVNTFPTLDFAS